MKNKLLGVNFHLLLSANSMKWSRSKNFPFEHPKLFARWNFPPFMLEKTNRACEKFTLQAKILLLFFSAPFVLLLRLILYYYCFNNRENKMSAKVSMVNEKVCWNAQNLLSFSSCSLSSPIEKSKLFHFILYRFIKIFLLFNFELLQFLLDMIQFRFQGDIFLMEFYQHFYWLFKHLRYRFAASQSV